MKLEKIGIIAGIIVVCIGIVYAYYSPRQGVIFNVFGSYYSWTYLPDVLWFVFPIFSTLVGLGSIITGIWWKKVDVYFSSLTLGIILTFSTFYSFNLFFSSIHFEANGLPLGFVGYVTYMTTRFDGIALPNLLINSVLWGLLGYITFVKTGLAKEDKITKPRWLIPMILSIIFVILATIYTML